MATGSGAGGIWSRRQDREAIYRYAIIIGIPRKFRHLYVCSFEKQRCEQQKLPQAGEAAQGLGRHLNAAAI